MMVLLDLLNAAIAIAAAMLTFRRRMHFGLLLFLAAPNFLGIASYLLAPDDRCKPAVAVSALALVCAFTIIAMLKT